MGFIKLRSMAGHILPVRSSHKGKYSISGVGEGCVRERERERMRKGEERGILLLFVCVCVCARACVWVCV